MTVQWVVPVGGFLFTVGSSALVPIVAGQEAIRPPGSTPSSSQVASSPAKPAEHPWLITLKDGRLSVRLHNRPIEWVLEEISRRAGVAFVGANGVEGRLVSVEFQDLPLDEGLREILKDHDAFFFYGVDEEKPAALKVIWVYPGGKGRGLEPVPPDKWASTKEIEERLADPDPEVRSRAVEALVERRVDKALEAVLKALRDSDDQVRVRALYGALGSGLELPSDSLMGALQDASPDVRFLALEALAGHPDARTIAESALNDPSPHVHLKAREILSVLDAAAKNRKPAQAQPRRPDP